MFNLSNRTRSKWIVESRQYLYWLSLCFWFSPMVSAQALSPADPVFNAVNGFDSSNVAVYESRIFEVPENYAHTALTMLAGREFSAIDERQASLLLPGVELDHQRMLARQIAAAEAYAERQENYAKEPGSSGTRSWLLGEAKTYRDYVAYTRTLANRLRPYLVASKACYGGDGRYRVILHEERLTVFYGTLGYSCPPAQIVPLVIFLENDITSVSVSSAGAN